MSSAPLAVLAANSAFPNPSPPTQALRTKEAVVHKKKRSTKPRPGREHLRKGKWPGEGFGEIVGRGALFHL